MWRVFRIVQRWGAILAVAALTSFFNMRQATAQGLGFAILPLGAVAASATYAAAGDIAWNASLPLAFGSVVGVSQGVALAHRLPERPLRIIFALLMIVSGLGLWFRA